MLKIKILISAVVFIAILGLSESGNAESNIFSTINGKQVDWILFFGNNPDPVDRLPLDGRRNKIPVVLVHGNHSESEPQARWSTFVERILNLSQFESEKYDIWIWKHDTAKPIGFNGHSGNAYELADCLNNYIFPYYQMSTKAVLVAHSRGGLVCRSFMNYDNDNNGKLDGGRIAGLITLGTPHHGSPAAVPDWAAFALRENHFGPTAFDTLYGPDKLIFSTNRLGDLNLAWDNLDGAILSGVSTFEYDSEISSNGEMYLTIRDTNQAVTIDYVDETIFFKDYWNPPDYKTMFGTLAELNTKDKFFKKIITYGAYDSIWLDNGDIGIGLFILEHEQLKKATLILGNFDVNNITKNGVNFYANDGMVPLQSALLLNISNGNSYASNTVGYITLDNKLFESDRIVKRHRIFTGNIKDHLDLLDTSDEQYWITLFSDILSFTKPDVTSIISSLLLNNEADNDGDGFTEKQGDCDDSNAALNPDTTWYKDSDNDGYSDGATNTQCLRPFGYKLSSELTAISGDCKDSDNQSFPGATEICGDGIDQNCNGSDLQCDPSDVDNDSDGYTENQGDCDDSNAALNPKTVWYKDSDNDGYADGTTKTQCPRPSGYNLPSELTATSGDCRDSDNKSYPGAAEICNDGIDQNCSGQADENCPVLSVTPTSLDFGIDKTQLTFTIDNSGTGTINWTVSENETWLGCFSPYGDTSGDGSYSGVGGETIYVEIGRNGLAEAEYTGDILVSSNGGDAIIQVRMKVEKIPRLTEASFLDIGHVYGIDVNGSVACATGGTLKLIDVSNPYNAILKSTVDTPDSAQGKVKIKGSYAYVADFSNAVTIVNISDIQNPTILGSESSHRGLAYKGIDVVGSYAFVGSITYSGLNTEHAYLQIVDVSDPMNPQWIKTIDLGESWEPDVQIVDNLLYLSRVGDGFHWIYDVSDPASPIPVANYPNTTFESIFVDQSYAYFTNSYNIPDVGLLIRNISNPYNPSNSGDVGTPTGAVDVCAYGDFAYIADQQTGVIIINVSDPTNPRVVNVIDFETNVESIFVKYPYLYVGSWDGLYIFEISND